MKGKKPTTKNTLPSKAIIQKDKIKSLADKQKLKRGFPGGTMVKNPPANAGDTSLSPRPVRSHMPRSN